jgi:hypothetical protein
MSAIEASTHTVRIEIRVEADKGTRRSDILAAVHQQAASLAAIEGAGWRISPGALMLVYFEDVGDNLAAERGW